tara:strand:+ start:1306 stop:2004 length:699 start_codon:yes stop_codon:yes gene_type:complete
MKLETQLGSTCPVQKAAAAGRVWERNIADIIRSHGNYQRGFIDVGSYIGSHALPASQYYRHVYSFEAVPKSFDLQTKSIENNNIKNVKLFNKIVYEESGKIIKIKTSQTGTGTSSICRHLKHYDTFFNVETIKLDDVEFKEGIGLIKIDVESAEWGVLLGASQLIKRDKPVIILETFKTIRNIEKLTRFAVDYNYKIDYLSADNYLLIPEYVSVHNLVEPGISIPHSLGLQG